MFAKTPMHTVARRGFVTASRALVLELPAAVCASAFQRERHPAFWAAWHQYQGRNLSLFHEGPLEGIVSKMLETLATENRSDWTCFLEVNQLWDEQGCSATMPKGFGTLPPTASLSPTMHMKVVHWSPSTNRVEGHPKSRWATPSEG